ncbi:MAG: asparagine synthase (glutamine-hydrolyzing) [Sandaracinaceae bacterium]|nr:asparagine synthase (glutamine-hydrolyzing) [Sandaracinaceae bacterium]
MCGVLGVLAPRGRFARPDLAAALDTLAHRGPDGAGLTRHDAPHARELWLGHRRLAIVDLSEAAAQPMQRGEATLVFNGEIYDHVELRASLDLPLSTSSDTEVLLEGLRAHGPPFLERCNGMWALAYHDASRRELVLARDRLGKKPLYLYEADDVIAFASEPKAFVALGLPLTIDEDARALYRWLGYLPARRTIYRECAKLPAATHLTISLGDPSKRTERLYWDPLGGFAHRFEGTFDDALDAVSALVDDATRLRVRADVPVGVFLSGGIDSTLVASSVARLGDRATRAFTVQPTDPRFDESPVARATAAQLGVPITVLPLGPEDYARQTDRAATIFDEPFADPSFIPTLAISEAARAHVTVVLTGDGGDELFMGYPWLSHPGRFFELRRHVAWVPGWRPAARYLLGRSWMEPLVRGAARVAKLRSDTARIKIAVLEDVVDARSAEDIYDAFHTMVPRQLLDASVQARLHGSLLTYARAWYPGYAWDAAASRGTHAILSGLDLVTYLRDDVLVKVDRATMAYGLEARSPLLDHRLVALAQSLDTELKVHRGVHKHPLRQLAARRVRGVHELAKRGFGIPLPAGGDGPTDRARFGDVVERRFLSTWR